MREGQQPPDKGTDQKQTLLGVTGRRVDFSAADDVEASSRGRLGNTFRRTPGTLRQTTGSSHARINMGESSFMCVPKLASPQSSRGPGIRAGRCVAVLIVPLDQ